MEIIITEIISGFYIYKETNVEKGLVFFFFLKNSVTCEKQSQDLNPCLSQAISGLPPSAEYH